MKNKEVKTKYTLRKDGRIMMNKIIDGKPKSFYGHSDREVEQKYEAFIRKPTPKPQPKVRTFKEVAEDWWEQKEPELSPGSVRVYRARVNDLKEYFKKTPIFLITPLEIVTYLNKLKLKGYSQKVINSKKSIIKGILDNALIAGEIQFNPCLNLPTVKGKRKVERQPASEEDIKKITKHREDSMIARMAYFILWTGCRRGEAAALQEKHIDREHGTAHICQTLVYSSPTPQIKDCPKTAAGVRDVLIPKNLLDNIPKYNNPETYVYFPRGLPKEREFQVLIDEYRQSIGISCTLHQLRHSYATMLHSAGVDVKDAQYLLGHSSIVVTQDIYTTLDNYAKKTAYQRINDHVQKMGQLSDVLSEPAKAHESTT